MNLSTIGFALQLLGILTFADFDVSEGITLTLTPGPGTTFNISRREVTGSKCTVCTGSGFQRRCSSSVVLTDQVAVPVEFTCSNPEQLFTAEVIRKMVCTTGACSGDVNHTDSGSQPLQGFNRSFIWNLGASGPKAFQLNFTQKGLRQIQPTESCPDHHTYSLQAFQSTGRVVLGRYCQGGSISSAQILRQGRLSLEVPGRLELQPALFYVAVGEEIKSLAVITVTVPEGTSSTELFSPNYPDSFPDDDLVEWRFHVPRKHYSAVLFLARAQPRCLKKEPAVEYHTSRTGSGSVVVALDDPQPTQIQGPFTFTLRNCEMDMTGADAPRLSLHFQVSTSRRSLPVLCSVDLRNEPGLSLYVKKTKPGSDCELKLNSVLQENLTAPPGTVSQLSFQDCRPQELVLTASRVIECRVLNDCPAAPVPLLVPAVAPCLPVPLHSVTWMVYAPQHGTVELLPPSSSLRQSLPGHRCHGNVLLRVAEGDGTSVGHFCSRGAIRKVQIHTNVTITATATGRQELRPSTESVLNVSFSKEISERYIFTVSPKKAEPVLLATPGWPSGMQSSATVSWIVTVPAEMEAQVRFTEVRQPKCSRLHTSIQVQSMGSLEEMYSRREDEEADSQVTISRSFYLNMTNCEAERGNFSVLTQITLQENRNQLLTIILGVAGGLLAVLLGVLTVVCLVMRKKRQLASQVSVYNQNMTSYLPGRRGFPKSREDNESHVYASIEDTLVYGHLLRDVHGPEVDMYRAFTGPTDAKPPSPVSVVEGAQVGTYQPFVPPSQQAPPVPTRPASHSADMMDNELYHSE